MLDLERITKREANRLVWNESQTGCLLGLLDAGFFALAHHLYKNDSSIVGFFGVALGIGTMFEFVVHTIPTIYKDFNEIRKYHRNPNSYMLKNYNLSIIDDKPKGEKNA